MQENILIAFYSQSGNTRRIAELICQQTAGTLYEITPETPYKSLYLGGGRRIKSEREAGAFPALNMPLPDVPKYAAIFLGTPNWGNSLSHPVLSFIERCDLSGKRIFPFCTHGGGGSGHIEMDIRKLCPMADVQKIFEVYGNGGSNAERAVQDWIGGLYNENFI
ncbi:MAG: flavodoxin [Clostridiales bacterium]|nr:flavodoxin [Clostridiales bacterium]